MTVPCLNCVAPKRHAGCHGACKEYKEYKEKLDRYNEQVRKEKERNRMLSDCGTRRLEGISRYKVSNDNKRKIYKREW